MDIKKGLLFLFIGFSVLWACNRYVISTKQKFVSFSDQPVVMDFILQADLVFIEAEINGEKGRFLFDNGFTNSAVNPDFAKRANLQFQNTKVTISDANHKKSQLRTTIVDTTEVRGQFFLNMPFYEINTNAFLPCDSIDGVIGASIINLANWKLDFESKKIAFSKQAFPEVGTPLSIDFSNNNSSFTTLTILGENYRCKIDLGRAAGIKVDREKAKKNFVNEPLQKQVGIMSLSATGLGNVDTSYLSKNQLTIKHRNSNLDLKAQVQLGSSPKYEGYIGLGYLKNYELTINSTDKKYWLNRAKIASDSDSTYGLAIYPFNGMWKVIKLDVNDSILKEVSLMQEVVQLDSIPMNQFENICAYKKYIIKKINRKEPLELVLRGNEHSIIIPYHRKSFLVID